MEKPQSCMWVNSHILGSCKDSIPGQKVCSECLLYKREAVFTVSVLVSENNHFSGKFSQETSYQIIEENKEEPEMAFDHVFSRDDIAKF